MIRSLQRLEETDFEFKYIQRHASCRFLEQQRVRLLETSAWPNNSNHFVLGQEVTKNTGNTGNLEMVTSGPSSIQFHVPLAVIPQHWASRRCGSDLKVRSDDF